MRGTAWVRSRVSRRAAAALALVLLVVGATFPSPERALLQKPFAALDARAERYLDRTTVQALSVYATCRLINATISVLQESSVQGAPGGLGVSVAAGQVLDPLNDLVERFSAVLLYSTAALAVMQVLVEIGAWSSAALLLPLGAAFLLAAVVWSGPFVRPAAVWGGRLLLLALVVRLAAPGAYLINERVYELFLAPSYATAAEALRGGGQQLAATQPQPEAEGFWAKLRSMVDSSVDMVGSLPELRETAERLVGEVVTLVAVFLIQTALLPLFVLWVLSKTVSRIFAGPVGGVSPAATVVPRTAVSDESTLPSPAVEDRSDPGER